MIIARFDNDDCFLSMHVSGHSGAFEEGKDVICAGASTLAYSVAQCVMKMHEEGKLMSFPHIEMVSGNMIVVCNPTKEHMAEADTVFRTVETGFQLLQETYPDNVRVIGLHTVVDDD